MTIANGLADLDELVLACRDDRSRSYISEAVRCYRAGAFRAAIVSTWIAVCYDVIDKLRELSLAGDRQAEDRITMMDRARAANDVANALKFERELLEVARDKFELISHLEFVDLDRLQQDRNRCAHPSLVSDEEVFTPTAELARLHIRSAVIHLLQYPPAQGKYALEKLLRDVQSDYFPSDADKAVESLASGPLRTPRASLVRNFVIVLVKNMLLEITDWPTWYRHAAATQAVSKLHREVFLQTAEDKFSSIVRAVSDERLTLVIRFFARLGECWEVLEVDVRTKLENFVLNLPTELLDHLDEILEIPALRTLAKRRLMKATRKELRETLFIFLPEAVADRFVELYVESANFDEANDWGKYVAVYASELTDAQQRKLIVGAGVNDQILNSFELSTVIAALRKSKKIQEKQFEALLAENNLEAYQLEQKT